MFKFTPLVLVLSVISGSIFVSSCAYKCNPCDRNKPSKAASDAKKLQYMKDRSVVAKCEPWVEDSFIAPIKSNNTFNAQNALSLARVCRLVWEEKPFINEVAKHWELDYLFTDLKSTDTQYLLIGNSKFTILCYRATQSSDVFTVLKKANYETVNNGYEHNVFKNIAPAHAGFRTSVADSFTAGLVDDIKFFRRSTNAESSPLFLTGHSLGGALATIARGKLKYEGIQTDSLYAFGSPVSILNNAPVGTLSHTLYTEYLNNFKNSNFYLRFKGDDVPRLDHWPKCYTPVGYSKQININGEISDFSCYKTKNFFSSIAWIGPWLLEWHCYHNLDKSYLPAITELVARERAK